MWFIHSQNPVAELEFQTVYSQDKRRKHKNIYDKINMSANGH